ncbi:CpsD/CapB family tyrosine-protein kinase [bacterium]|nr:CpsD/CapB family tyrosine-protein kinase [bacterium]
MRIFTKRKNNEIKPTIFEYYQDESSSAVEFRRLTRNIWQNTSQEVNSLMVTSATAGEGKTLLAANLAITIAKSEGKRVLLIDCDMRRPAVHSLFSLERDVGLGSLLMEETALEETIQNTELENLKIITSGKDVISPMRLLGSERTEEILDECKPQFDLIICDTPPIIAVHDAEVLVPYVDGVLLVVLAGKTFQQVVMRSIEVLKEAQANVLGVVLNDMKGMLPYYYQPKYYNDEYYSEESS